MGGMLLGLGVLSVYSVPFYISTTIFSLCWVVGIVAGTSKSVRNFLD